MRVSFVFLLLLSSFFANSQMSQAFTSVSYTDKRLDIQIQIDSINSVAHFTVEGPADRYFAFAFHVSEMTVGAYTLVFNALNRQLVEEFKMAKYDTLSSHPTQNLQNITHSIANDRLRVSFSRALKTNDLNDIDLSNIGEELYMIYAVGQDKLLDFHNDRGSFSLFFNDLATGVSSNNLNFENKILQNPLNNNTIYLTSKHNGLYQILDSYGRVIERNTLNNSEIKPEKLKSGVYFLELIYPSKTFNQRFVVE
jgi:hypothetical protein